MKLEYDPDVDAAYVRLRGAAVATAEASRLERLASASSAGAASPSTLGSSGLLPEMAVDRGAAHAQRSGDLGQ